VWGNPCINCQLARFSQAQLFQGLSYHTHSCVLLHACSQTNLRWSLLPYNLRYENEVFLEALHLRLHSLSKASKKLQACETSGWYQGKSSVFSRKSGSTLTVNRKAECPLFSTTLLLETFVSAQRVAVSWKSVGKLIVVPDILSNSKKWGLSEFCELALCKLARSFFKLTAIQQITQFAYC